MTYVSQFIEALAFISIHMPHTWHDSLGIFFRSRSRHFNPHATYVA